jgi:hypothetical protein
MGSRSFLAGLALRLAFSFPLSAVRCDRCSPKK